MENPGSKGFPAKFVKIGGGNNQFWSLLETGNSLLAAATSGVYSITNSSSEIIQGPWNSPYCLYQPVLFPGIVVVGMEGGLALLQNTGGSWQFFKKIKGIAETIKYIGEDNSHNIWLGTSNSGLIRISDFSPLDEYSGKIDRFDNRNGLPEKEEILILHAAGRTLFLSDAQLLSFDQKNNKFVRDSLMNYLASGKNIHISFVYQDVNNIIWETLTNQDNKIELHVAVPDGKGSYYRKSVSYLRKGLEFNNDFNIVSITGDNLDKNIVWFVGVDGVYKIDSRSLNIPANKKPGIHISNIILLHGDSLFFAGDNNLKKEVKGIFNDELKPGINSIQFEFAALDFDEENLNEYSYILEGFDNKWSQWSAGRIKDYTNLPPGDYVFKVRTKNIYNVESLQASFSFSIDAPWYLKWWVRILYLLLFFLFIYLIVKYRLRFLEQKNIELEKIIEDRTKKIREQTEKLKEMDQIKTRFFTNISHEFRTPLTLILGEVDSSLKLIEESKVKNKLGVAFTNAQRLEKLINQLLEISKIEDGKLHLEFSRKNLIHFIRTMFYSFESLAEQKGITLSFNSNSKEAITLFDIEKMEKIFNNIFSNAVKFSKVGGLIDCSITAGVDIIEIAVKDTGIGIPANRISHIFDRFYQVDKSSRNDVEGTGIGLTLAKELIELHDGTISVNSRENEGTTFTIRIPLNTDVLTKTVNMDVVSFESIRQINSEPDAIHIDIHTSGYLILIIDDNADIRFYMRENLEDEYKIVEAENGEEGFKIAQKMMPDLIISDIMMPLMDGYTLLNKLKNNTLTSHIPVIILTAKAAENDKILGLDIGADDYIIKPFSSAEIVARVRNLIKTRKALRQKFSITASFDPDEVTSVTLDRKFLNTVISAINNNISDSEFTADKLSDLSAISISQLNKKLNALVGQPAGQLIRTKRLEKAAVLLKNGNLSIKEIAWQVGYSELPGFTSRFKKHFGVSPSQFRA